MESARISDLVLRVFEGDPWHGSSTAALLDGVTAADAVRRPAGHAHSIWEIVLHMTGWAVEVRHRVQGRPAQEPDGGDWPAVGDPSEARWRAAQGALAEAHHALAATVTSLGDDDLVRPVADFRDAAQGTGLSRYLTLHGLIHHTVYHSGQIGLLKSALR
jgi:uncharacterized damage-inducible protein DinB